MSPKLANKSNTLKRNFKFNLKGRVKNYDLTPNKFLEPLYEAVVNSLQSIKNSAIDNGVIRISIIRDKSQLKLADNIKNTSYITGFKITDNGEGFNDQNINDFFSPDSSSKKNCKGIGRFSWLKAFERVFIKSTFWDSEHKLKTREFTFTIEEQEPSILEYDESKRSKPQTTIELNQYKDGFLKAITKKKYSGDRIAGIIGSKLLNHCLDFFINNQNLPKIILYDEQSQDDEVCLNEIFNDKYVSVPDLNFEIKSEQFTLKLYKVFIADQKNNVIFYCVEQRIIDSEKIKLNDVLKNKIKDENGNSYSLVGYITSNYLDDHANSSRTSIDIESDATDDEENLTKDDINKVVNEQLIKAIVDLQSMIRKNRENAIEYIKHDQPKYRVLLEDDSLLDNVPITNKKTELEVFFHKEYYSRELEVKKNLLNTLRSYRESKEGDNLGRTVELNEILKSQIQKYNNLTQVALSDYILKRKVILEYLKSIMEMNDEGRFELENAIHNLIFPQHITSDNMLFDYQNLWLLDERLNYHEYLDSDIQLNKNNKTKSPGRPDILIFDKVLPFNHKSEGNPRFDSITLIEFKRPGNYKKQTKDPINQIIDYIEEIKKGSKRKKNGRKIEVDDDTKFFAYIITELSDDVVREAKKMNLAKTHDNCGYFGYSPDYKLWIEIMNFDRLLAESLKRNKVFFDKLGVGS